MSAPPTTAPATAAVQAGGDAPAPAPAPAPPLAWSSDLPSSTYVLPRSAREMYAREAALEQEEREQQGRIIMCDRRPKHKPTCVVMLAQQTAAALALLLLLLVAMGSGVDAQHATAASAPLPPSPSPAAFPLAPSTSASSVSRSAAASGLGRRLTPAERSLNFYQVDACCVSPELRVDGAGQPLVDCPPLLCDSVAADLLGAMKRAAALPRDPTHAARRQKAEAAADAKVAEARALESTRAWISQLQATKKTTTTQTKPTFHSAAKKIVAAKKIRATSINAESKTMAAQALPGPFAPSALADSKLQGRSKPAGAKGSAAPAASKRSLASRRAAAAAASVSSSSAAAAAAFVEQSSVSSQQSRSPFNPAQRWARNEVFYRLSVATLALDIEHLAVINNAFNNAMREWMAKTCVRFHHVAPGQDAVSLGFIEDHASHTKNLGRRATSVFLQMTRGWTFGVPTVRPDAVHELGHVLGLDHMHARSDRDLFVRPNLDLAGWCVRHQCGQDVIDEMLNHPAVSVITRDILANPGALSEAIEDIQPYGTLPRFQRDALAAMRTKRDALAARG